MFSLNLRKFVPCSERKPEESSYEDFPRFLQENYENLEKIGEGAQGKVFKVLEKKTESIKALKCLRTDEPELISQVCFYVLSKQ